MITYICKYSPLELLEACGESVQCPNLEAADLAAADPYMHSSVCAHARHLLSVILPHDTRECEACSRKNHIFLTNCCDSIRRVYDVLSSGQLSDVSAEIIDLPHKTDKTGIAAFASSLLSMAEKLHLNMDEFLRLWRDHAQQGQAILSRRDGFIGLLGARMGEDLKEKLESTLPLPLLDLTCGGVRFLPPPPENASELSLSDLMVQYAQALLSQIPCMRMGDISGRNRLLQLPMHAIVYHTIRFCDYYSFEYAQLCSSVSVPILKLETDYTRQNEGQLRTRLLAFAETLPCGGAETPQKGPKMQNNLPKEDRLYAGIDSGSTTTNLAVINRNGELLASCILRTGARADRAAARALEMGKEQLGTRADQISSIYATGYGREFISFADGVKTEISCHAKGAHHLNPDSRTIIDIGGQDSKIICLDENGQVTNFIMNDKCAAGTGRFLEMMSTTLEMSLDEMSLVGLDWKQDLTISSVCTVFAESEVVSLIAQNHTSSDIVHALSKSVALKTCQMAARSGGSGPYMMTGGVAKNRGVVQEIENRLSTSLYISETPDLTGAIGAALFALESDS